MIDFRRWNFRLIAIIATVALIAVFQLSFFSPVRDSIRRGLSVPSNLLDSISTKATQTFRIFFSINELSRENNELKFKNAELEAQLAKLADVETENITLRSDLNFQKQRADLKLAPAEVISFSPTGQYQAFVINRGEEDGVKVGQAVVSNGFLIGKLNKVDKHSSEVWLITNPNLLTPIILTKSQTVGILSGGIRGLVAENIPLDTDVSVGESIVTSSLEGVYPSGIAIGKVEEIISRKEDIFISLRISSPIKFGNLTVVFVVTE